MVPKRFKYGVAIAAILASWASQGFSNETITYSYDALGRLVATTTSGTVNNSVSTSTSFDPAGNRTNYAVSGVSTPTNATLSIGSASVTEGGALVFTVTRSGVTTSTVSASYASASGTAISGSDFTAVSNTVSFAANEISKTISVTTIDDAVVESAETMTVTLSAPSAGAVLGTAIGTGTINDNDVAPPPSFAVGNASAVTEGGTLVYTVTKTGTTSSSFSVNFATANGTAVSGSDYTANSGTLTFLAADTSKTISVTTIDDTAVESAETVLVNLSGATGGATITTSQGSGTINDNDTVPNQPPTLVADTMITVPKCGIGFRDVVSNDTDPEGNYPLSLVSVSPGTLGSAFLSSSTTIEYDGGQVAGTETLTYVVRDSLGATSTGSLSARVTTTDQCNSIVTPPPDSEG